MPSSRRASATSSATTAPRTASSRSSCRRSTVESIWTAIEADPSTEITVDVERLSVEVPSAGITHSFPMDPQTQHRFLNGLDDVGITLTHVDDITDFEKHRPAWLR